MKRNVSVLAALALLLPVALVEVLPAHATSGACTMEVSSSQGINHPMSGVDGFFGGPECRDSWVSVDFSFGPDSVTGAVTGTSRNALRRDIEVWSSRSDLPWPIAVGWWGTERLGLRVGSGQMTGGVALNSQQEVGKAIAGEPAGTPVAVSLARREMPRGARSIREWNLGAGQCEVDGRRIDVMFNYRAEWSDGADLDAVTDLQSISVSNDLRYGPLCLALVLATPLPD